MITRPLIWMAATTGAFWLAGLLSMAAPAAAHDPDCVATTHLGGIKQHFLCGASSVTDAECVLSVHVSLVKAAVLCGPQTCKLVILTNVPCVPRPG